MNNKVNFLLTVIKLMLFYFPKNDKFVVEDIFYYVY